ncbi:hypothetical protein BOTBODRAFT_138789 [Botryobasidium botryosum FD-172 SS1]|uniref:Lysine-specific metallo-endopeptidase domain-containing protein n=1 Tax=Botryobasidium botryosum (strain FD-172 SS1) TaxID=930990 RepID=A0A067LZ34_BOTB1|nr:hypothetical protein BOTBODRAFT_138789 [Botryobasidium botryosum FD-172 SS1]
MLACALALSLQLASLIAAAPSLSITVSSPEVIVNGVNNLHVTTTIYNTCDETLKLLNDPRSILTPDWETDIFRIVKTGSGVGPDFRGVAAKWSPTLAVESNFVTVIPPGQSIELVHDLSRRYDFTKAGAGVFDFHPRDTFTHIDPAGNHVSLKAELSVHASVTLSGSLSPVRVSARSAKFTKRAQFNGCTRAHKVTIDNAIAAATESAGRAYEYLAVYNYTDTPSLPRYETWFGEFAAPRHETIVYTVEAMLREGFAGFKYDCHCPKADTFAYVYPNQFGEIYLCAAFWKAPARGTDSRAGTLIHESSHFWRIGSTQDYAYGHPECESLAKRDPEEAVKNADSYEYFAENTPHLD